MLQQQAYERIKAKIIACEYAPGTLLNTLDLQARFGFSRTPIREALGRLEQEHLIRVIPKKGFIVCAFSLDTITHVFETRLVLEPYLVATYGDRVDAAALRNLRAVFSEELTLDKERFFAKDMELHALIRAACPNVYLTQPLDRISDQTRRLRKISEQQHDRIRESCAEHHALIDAMLTKNFELAAELMRRHLQASRQVAFSLPGLP